MAQIESQAYHNDVENPPAGFISHEIFQHFFTIKNVRVYTPLLFPEGELSTIQALENLFCYKIFLSPFKSALAFLHDSTLRTFSNYWTQICADGADYLKSCKNSHYTLLDEL
jgi:hypothetical protein